MHRLCMGQSSKSLCQFSCILQETVMFKTREPGLVVRSHPGNLVRTFQLEIQRAGDFLFFFLDLSGARLIHLSYSELLGPKHRSRQGGSGWVSP